LIGTITWILKAYFLAIRTKTSFSLTGTLPIYLNVMVQCTRAIRLNLSRKYHFCRIYFKFCYKLSSKILKKQFYRKIKKSTSEDTITLKLLLIIF